MSNREVKVLDRDSGNTINFSGVLEVEETPEGVHVVYNNGEEEATVPGSLKDDTGFEEENNILEDANDTVGVRAEEYGPPTENFQAIADMWSGYLGIEITPYDYSQMMILAKIGRTKTGSPDRDTHQDEAGYALTTSLVNQDGSDPGPYLGGE